MTTGEKDISTKKQKKAVTSSVFNELRPFSEGCRIVSVLSKKRVTDGEGFDENDVTSFIENEYDKSDYPNCAESCALLENPIFFPDDRQALETIFTLWPRLSPETKIGIMKMIEAATADETLGPC